MEEIDTEEIDDFELDIDIVTTICDNLTEDAKEVLRQAKIDAEAEGRKKGLAEEIEKGMSIRAREIAENLLKQGYPVDSVSSACGLDIGEVRDLLKTMRQ